MNNVPMAGSLNKDGSYVNGIEDFVPTSQYDRREHRKKVVEDIVENWVTLSQDSKFHAIFATSSIRRPLSIIDWLREPFRR